MVSRTSFGRIANTLAGSTPGLIVPIARIFVVGVDVVMGCAYPEFGPKRLKISIRPAERACFIYLLHNVRRLVHWASTSVLGTSATTQADPAMSAWQGDCVAKVAEKALWNSILKQTNRSGRSFESILRLDGCP